MADKSTEKAQQTAREATGTAGEAVETATATAQRASEAGARGYEEFLTLGRDNMEGMAGASRAMLKGTTELGSVWASFWNEQLTSGMEAMRSLAECRSWDDALNVQDEFNRASLNRVCSRVVKSAELSAEMLATSLPPLQASARRAAERVPRRAA